MTNLFRPSKNETHKSKFILGGIMVSLMLMAYQNCGKVSKTNPNSLDGAVEQKPAVMNLDSSIGLTLLKSSNEGFGMYAYKVDVNTGKVERTMYEVPAEDPSNLPAHLCLSEEQRAELERIVNESSVCFFKQNNDPNQMCHQIYSYPYAIVNQRMMSFREVPDRIFKLGEKASGCSDVYDICKDNRDAFVNTIKEILIDIDLSQCE